MTSPTTEFIRAREINPRESYSVEEIAKLLGVSYRTIYRIIDRGELKAIKFGETGKLQILGKWVKEAVSEA